MKVVVIGAGAMGGLFGAILAEAGNDVHLVCARQEHAAAINAQGLIILKEREERRIAVAATTNLKTIPAADLSIIFVKSPDTPGAAESAARLTHPNGWILTLQNGLGNADVLARCMDVKQIIAGTTAHGATLMAPGRVRHAGEGLTVIGMWADPDSRGADLVAKCFNAAGIETRVVADVRRVIWEKLLVNVGINAITALTGIKNGVIPDLPNAQRLCRAAVEEAAAVAKAKGIVVPEDAVARVFQVARATAGNRSSMGQDVDRKKRTEIDVINGAVVKLADDMGMAVPVNRTLTALVEILEAGYSRLPACRKF